MEVGENVEIEHSTRKRKRYVRGHGTKTIKSHRGQWVEEDMTMDPPDTKNNFTKKEVVKDYYIDVYVFIHFIL